MTIEHPPVRINLALQGGGAHGAYTWGVLDRLLEDETITIAAVSGTSAGALNAAALKAGLIRGGHKGARRSLDRLWRDVGRLTDLRIPEWMQPLVPGMQTLGQIALSLSPVSAQGIAAQLYSPYAWGPMWRNPLESVVRRLDFSGLQQDQGPRLFVGATCVETGRIRVFEDAEVTAAALMASACLPSMFQAVQIDGQHFWDGGYSGNPALFPMYQPDLPDDLLIVSINPLYREGLPKTPLEIQNRVNEISFNATLLGELRAVNFVRRLIHDGRMERGQMKEVLVHLISDDTTMNELSATTKLLPSAGLFDKLKAAGRASAEQFLTDHRGKLGVEPSFPLAALFA